MTDERRRRQDRADSARAKCYDQIRSCMKSRLLNYYQAHPDLLGDERSQRAIHESTEGLACIFEVLDAYEITCQQKETLGDSA